MVRRPTACAFFFFNDTATTEIYTLSLHDALPISGQVTRAEGDVHPLGNPHYWLDPENGLRIAKGIQNKLSEMRPIDRKSTRLNSSHGYISYAVFCLKKKKNHTDDLPFQH